MAKLFTATAIASALLLSTGAVALDIENQDATEHEVTFAGGDGGPTTLKLKPGEIKRNLCGDEWNCSIMLGNQSSGTYGGAGNEHVVIKEGKLQPGKPRS